MGGCRGDSGLNSKKGKKIKVLLDTNFILLLADGIDFFNMIEEKLDVKPIYIVLNIVVDELVELSKQNPSMAKKVDFVLNIIKDKCVFENTLIEVEDVDEALIEYALAFKAAVATNDKELRKRLRKLGIPEIYLREESRRVSIEGLNP